MKANYRVSINGWSTEYETREEAMQAAQRADAESVAKVYNRYNNVVWEY